MSSLIPLVFIWLDKRNGTVPGGNEKLKGKFRKLLVPFRQFDKPTSCLDCIEQSLKDQRVFLITSVAFADELFLKKVASFANVHRLYVYDQQEVSYQMQDPDLLKKMGSKRIIQFDERLYEQIVLDLVEIYSHESERSGKGTQAKALLQSALQLLDTVDDKDDEFQQLEALLQERLKRLQ